MRLHLCARTPPTAHEEMKGQPTGVGFLHPVGDPHGLQDSKQEPLPTELACQSWCFVFLSPIHDGLGGMDIVSFP